jgi:ABC-type glutathione transport system ATPase component
VKPAAHVAAGLFRTDIRFSDGGEMAAITLSKLNKHYGSLFHAVKDVDLEIADKEFVALVGQ